MTELFHNEGDVKLDEIIHIHAWHLAKPQEELSCWFHTNSQLLLKKHNRDKGTKCNEQDKMALLEDVRQFYLNNKTKAKDIVDATHISAIYVTSYLGEVLAKETVNERTIAYVKWYEELH